MGAQAFVKYGCILHGRLILLLPHFSKRFELSLETFYWLVIEGFYE